MFPIAVAVATLANSAGIGGATFFSPLMLIVLGLPPEVAIGTALVTEVFGFPSGVTAHARARTIDWLVARRLIAFAVPAGIIGSLIGGAIPEVVLKTVLGFGLLAIAVAFIRHVGHDEEDVSIARGEGIAKPYEERTVVSRDGEVFEYKLCRHREGQLGAGVGGLFVGAHLDRPRRAEFVRPGQALPHPDPGDGCHLGRRNSGHRPGGVGHAPCRLGGEFV